jgi:hypothetical protein
MVPVVVISVCCCDLRAVTDNVNTNVHEWVWLCVIKLFLQKQEAGVLGPLLWFAGSS